MTETGIYRKLQQHLNRQAVGYPATRKGAEIAILRHIFSPDEAEIALVMSYKYETADDYRYRLGTETRSLEDVEVLLDRMILKGGIFTKTLLDKRYFALAPLVVGMYELQGDRLTHEFIHNFREYTSSRRFGIDFLSTNRPQMRTIPIGETVFSESTVRTYDDVNGLIDRSEGPFAVVECICRKKKEMEGESCLITHRRETCLAMGNMAEAAFYMGAGRMIDRETARGILLENQKEGLVLQPSNSKDAEFICSCCSCCCGILGIHHLLPRPLQFWETNYHSRIDAGACNGCGVCEKRCPVGAVRVYEKGLPAKVDLHLCLGCGVCVTTCPKKALSLTANEHHIEPPDTMEDLYDGIMENKKGPFDKFKILIRLVVDVFRSGRFDILKP